MSFPLSAAGRSRPARRRAPAVIATLVFALSGLPAHADAGASAATTSEPRTRLATPAPAGDTVSARMLGRLLVTDVTRAGTRIVAVGEHGMIIHSDDEGATWHGGAPGRRAMLTSVRFADAQHGWAVGHDGLILATTDGGSTWAEQRHQPDEEKPLLALWCKSANEVIAIGAYGLYVETEDGGATWTERTISDADSHLNAITGFGENRLAIAGEAGTLLVSADGGRNWTPSISPYAGSYFGVLRIPGDALLAYGLRGKAFRSEDAGKTWQAIDSAGPVTLLGGAAREDGLVVLVGAAGTVRLSRDGGRHFRAEPSGLPVAFSAALPLDDRRTLLFGEAGMAPLTLSAAASDGPSTLPGARP